MGEGGGRQYYIVMQLHQGSDLEPRAEGVVIKGKGEREEISGRSISMCKGPVLGGHLAC